MIATQSEIRAELTRVKAILDQQRAAGVTGPVVTATEARLDRLLDLIQSDG